MATQVQRRRGTTAEHSTFTGAVGETTVDTSKDTVVVHDGSTQGGFPLLREDMSNNQTPSVERITLSEYAEFDTSYTPTESEPQGALYWNSEERTLSLVTNGQTTELGQKLEIECRNATGSTIARGVPVYASGTIGNSGRITVAPMIADGTIDAKYIVGVTDEQILNGEDGKVVKVGKIRKIDTSAYSEGDVLYVSETSAGAWTSTKPSVPNISLPIAFVVTDHPQVGEIFVRVEAIDENAFQPYDAELATLATMSASQALGLTGQSGTSVEFDDVILDGDLSINGDTASDDYSAETTGWQIDSSGAADFRSIYVDSIITQAFIAEVAQALAGEDFLTKSVTLLEEDFTVPSGVPSTTGIKVKPLQGIANLSVFEQNDWLRMRVVSSAQGLTVYDVYAKVTSVGSVDIDGAQNYTVQVDYFDSGAAGEVIGAGSLVLDYGQSGDYFIERSVLNRATVGDYDKVPYDRIVQWTNTSGSGSPRAGDGATFTTISVVGNLGVYDSAYNGDFGFYSSKALLTDDIIVGSLDKSGNYLSFDNTFGLTVVADAAYIDTPQMLIDAQTSGNGNKKIILDSSTTVGATINSGSGFYAKSDGDVRIGNASGNYIKFDGTDLDIVTDVFTLDTADLKINSTEGISLEAVPNATVPTTSIDPNFIEWYDASTEDVLVSIYGADDGSLRVFGDDGSGGITELALFREDGFNPNSIAMGASANRKVVIQLPTSSTGLDQYALYVDANGFVKQKP